MSIDYPKSCVRCRRPAEVFHDGQPLCLECRPAAMRGTDPPTVRMRRIVCTEDVQACERPTRPARFNPER